MSQELVPMDGTVPSAPGQSLTLNQHVELGVAGLTFSEGATPDELQAVAQGFDTLQRTTGFAVGDLANFYRSHFPERFQAWVAAYPVETKNAELDQKTIKVYAAVCAFFPHAIRERFLIETDDRRALSFSHFSRVRRYGMETACYWLERAATENLTIDQMTALIDEGAPGSDEHPPVPEIPDSQFGFIYDLGRGHKLLCGDSTVLDHVRALCGEESPSMVWTDPPYGVDYVGKTEEALTIQNDSADGLEPLLIAAWANAADVCVPAAPIYCTGPSGDRGEVFLRSFRLAGCVFKQYLIWLKNRMILGRSDYHYKHEPIFYAQTPGPKMGRTVKPRLNWYAGDNSTSVFEVDSPPASRDHPTMKPVKLIRQHIENSSRPGEIVLDLFAGSGSTIIAAEQSGRRAFVVEFDPRYADVIRTRVQAYYEEQERAAAIQPAPIIEGTATVVNAAAESADAMPEA